MSCSIINQTTQTTLTHDKGHPFDKSAFFGNAQQSPDISRMTLDALIRRQMRSRTASAPSYWSHFLSRNTVANGNDAD